MLSENLVGKRQLFVLESLTLLALLGLVFWSVAPLLEEWGLINAFNAHGVGYVRFSVQEFVMRPLQLLPIALEWVLGNGDTRGLTVGVGVLLVMRYFVVRWAVSPLLHGYNRWVVATLAAVLVAWPGVWLVRFTAAQLSAVFFFAALGFAIRLFQRWSFGWAIGLVFSVLLLLMTYQGLALCFIAILVLLLFWHRVGDSEAKDTEKDEKTNKAARILLPLTMGFGIYGIYWFEISRVMGNAGYEGALAATASRLLNPADLWFHFKAAFATAYGQDVFLLPFMLLIASFLNWNGAGQVGYVKSRLISGVIIFLVVAFLPVLSMIYVSELHIRDIDRILFPVSIGFVLVCLAILIQHRVRRFDHSNVLNSSIVVMLLLMVSGFVAHQVKLYAKIQSIVIEQTLVATNQSNAQSVIIRDMTGTLGDVYTLLNPTLTHALAVNGKNITATICTPLSVDRMHAVAQRYPIVSTQRCEELPAVSEGTLILMARSVNGMLTVGP